jgi:NAD(P)-dependent dehydrogenase (short-subunit alcohol dehydrogenase family)
MPQNGAWKGAIALVTGANKGIGFEIARGLGEHGATVLLGCRDQSLGNAAATTLKADGLDVRPIVLDVTNGSTIQAAAARLESEFGRLDILVNNAGIALEPMTKPSEVPLDVVRRVYDVNVFGVIAVTQALLPLLAKSERGRIVNVSSTLGSIGMAAAGNGAGSRSERGDPAFLPTILGYNSSKSALNSVTVQFANELRGTPIKVNAACPGYCATDLNRHSGPRTARQGAQTPVKLATLPDDGPTGGFFNDEGVVAW